MLSVAFEPAIRAIKWVQAYVLDGTATEMVNKRHIYFIYFILPVEP